MKHAQSHLSCVLPYAALFIYYHIFIVTPILPLQNFRFSIARALSTSYADEDEGCCDLAQLIKEFVNVAGIPHLIINHSAREQLLIWH